MVLLFIALFGIAFIGMLYALRKKKKEAAALAQALIDQAQVKAALLLDEARLKKKELMLELEQKRIVQERALEKEAQELNGKVDQFERLRLKIQAKEQELAKREKKLKSDSEELDARLNLTLDEAKTALLEQARSQIEKECLELELQKRLKAEKRAQETAYSLIITALSRLPEKALHDASCTQIALPNEEMKAKIIGREGKNIKAFQQLSGVNLVIDETPQMLTLSSFDLERRHIAHIALQELMRDGKISPTRIEEELNFAKKRLQEELVLDGKRAAESCDVLHLHPELLRHLGLLQLSSSLGQNLLEHSVEVAQIIANMALELKLNASIARRMGLLHDIGKAASRDQATTHALMGYRLSLAYGETEIVANGVGCHHDEMAPLSCEAQLVKCADYLSGARAGARAQNSETFFKRLSDFEAQALSFEGVKHAFAISAGRELQVFVRPELVDDAASLKLAKAIAKKIEAIAGPQPVQVSVIRETKSIVFTT